jgi:Ca-activated chloride channel family protein
MSAERVARGRAGIGLTLCLLGVSLLSTAALLAQNAPFRARVDIVEVTVSVTDGNGRLITGLAKDDFQIFEDGVEQAITQFTDQRVPVSVELLLDASDSMRGQPVVDARLALDRFVGELLLPGDEVFVATFNHRPRLASKWTTPPSALQNVLADLKPSGGTAIYDALAETSRLFERRKHVRAASIVISDGADTASDRSLYQAIEVIRRNDAFVYALAIDAPDARAATRVNPDSLREITSLTGGYTEVVRTAADLGPATARIADELNKQYTIGYSSLRPPDGKWRPLRVRVRSGEYFVRARRGYFAEALSQ